MIVPHTDDLGHAAFTTDFSPRLFVVVVVWVTLALLVTYPRPRFRTQGRDQHVIDPSITHPLSLPNTIMFILNKTHGPDV